MPKDIVHMDDFLLIFEHLILIWFDFYFVKYIHVHFDETMIGLITWNKPS